MTYWKATRPNGTDCWSIDAHGLVRMPAPANNPWVKP